MLAGERVKIAQVEGGREVFTREFVELLVHLHDTIAPRVGELRRNRAAVLERALKHRDMPGH